MNRSRPYEGLALITDLDGTLLLPDKTLSPADAAAIADFREKGGIFSIATGRGIQATQEYIDLLQPDFPAVMYNGALVYDAEKQAPAYAAHLPAETGALLTELMREFPAVGTELLDLSGVYVIQDGEYERRHLAITHLQMNLRSLSDMEPAKCMKALFAGSPEDISRMTEYVQAERFSVVSFTRSHDWFLEILPLAANKGTALSRIRQMLPAGTFIGATGDFDNDTAMLEKADFCGCPADAQESVLEAVRGCGGFVGRKTCADGFFAEWTAAFTDAAQRRNG